MILVEIRAGSFRTLHDIWAPCHTTGGVVQHILAPALDAQERGHIHDRPGRGGRRVIWQIEYVPGNGAVQISYRTIAASLHTLDKFVKLL